MWIAVLIGIMVAIVVGVALVPTIVETTNSLPDDTPAGIQALVDVLPYVFVAVIILGAVAWIGHGVMDEDAKVVGKVGKYIRVKRWDQFGERMKVAYEAKFGFSSSDFNNQVDSHVKAMRALGKGYTKSVDMDWMKRMAKFVEVPWAIPEEEKWSETEKTRRFGRR